MLFAGVQHGGWVCTLTADVPCRDARVHQERVHTGKLAWIGAPAEGLLSLLPCSGGAECHLLRLVQGPRV